MSETIGAALKAAREKRRLSLAQVSETTRIRGHYLQALENDDLSAMHSAAQARGFLHIYASFLDLDLSTLVPPAPAEAEPAVVPAPEAPKETAPRTELKLTIPPALLKLRDQIASRLPRRAAGEASGGPSEPELPAADDQGKKKALK